MRSRNICCDSRCAELNRVPAEAFALFFHDLLENRHGLRPAILPASSQDGIDESNRSGVRGAVRSGLDRGEKDFIAFAGQRGNVGVRDADAIGIARVGRMHAFNGLAQAAAEADSKDEVALIHGADKMSDTPRRRRGEDRQAEQSDLILEIIGENCSEISGKEHDAAGVVKALGEGDEARRIQAVLESVQILEILLESIANIGRHAGDAAAGLHGVERSGEGYGKVVEMALKITVAGETEAADDANDGSGVGVKAHGHSAHAEENVIAGVLQDGADDLLAFGAEELDALR